MNAIRWEVSGKHRNPNMRFCTISERRSHPRIDLCRLCVEYVAYATDVEGDDAQSSRNLNGGPSTRLCRQDTEAIGYWDRCLAGA